ncbi:MAG TPA: ATP-dependent DNA ligase [Nanoarchaeota archaeon]|nr:ATP-dependent DNA ligase [Nanoarchaeota archaeon]
MLYSELVKIYQKLETRTSKLEKIKIIANFIKKIDEKNLKYVIYLLQGRVFPKYDEHELGVASQLMIKAISRASGISESKINEMFKKSGDLGKVAEIVVRNRRQSTLFRIPLTVEKVFENLRKVALQEGEGSQDRKISLIAELLTNASPEEAKYIVRTVLEELRIGVAEGILRDAIALAYNIDVDTVEYAWNILSDFAEVAKIASKMGRQGLKNVKPKLGKPIQMMLGVAAKSIEEVLREYRHVVVEFKYDGFRAQIHKKGNKIWIFSRRLENVTSQFPDIVEACKNSLKAEECIVEGEIWAVDEKGNPKPFQLLSQRIHRKYDIHKMVEKIPVQLNLFDIVFLNGEVLFSKPLKERRKLLFQIVEESNKLKLAEFIETNDVKKIREFYQRALDLGQEGIMIKNLDAPYMFGRHVGGWYKIKPTMENLDLVIIGAEWGTGKRAGWFGSLILGCRDPDTGEFLECGMLGTGIKEKKESPGDVTFEEITQMLKPLIIKEEGKKVWVKPKIVVEVSYEEIQRSPNYASGFALRFPRFVRLREDKSPEEADTLERIKKLYESQKH